VSRTLTVGVFDGGGAAVVGAYSRRHIIASGPTSTDSTRGYIHKPVRVYRGQCSHRGRVFAVQLRMLYAPRDPSAWPSERRARQTRERSACGSQLHRSVDRPASLPGTLAGLGARKLTPTTIPTPTDRPPVPLMRRYPPVDAHERFDDGSSR
jgi:hypothetical protein